VARLQAGEASGLPFSTTKVAASFVALSPFWKLCGVAIGTCTLYDTDGPIGYSTVTGLANEVLDVNE